MTKIFSAKWFFIWCGVIFTIFTASTILVGQELITGDADGNGTVDTFDALIIAEYDVGLKTQDELPGFSVADVDCGKMPPDISIITPESGTSVEKFPIIEINFSKPDKIINIFDALAIASFDAGIIDSFDAGEYDIDVSTLNVNIDGQNKTSLFAISDNQASYTITDELLSGEHIIIATIQDTGGNTGKDISIFSVTDINVLPGASPTSGTAPLTVHFTTDAEDPGGTIHFFRWDFEGDDNWDTYDTVAQDYEHTYNNPGIYKATLSVENGAGETAAAVIVITVDNNPPTATADISPSNGAIPLIVQLSGTGHSDGQIVLYEWDFDGDGSFDWSSDETGNTTHAYTTEGTHQAVFRVTDNIGLTATAVAMTTVIQAGPPGSPTAIASVDSTSGDAPLTVNFTGTATDPDGNDTIASYEWDFDGDGVYDSDIANPTHTYTEAGTHIASLKVTDNTGLTGIDQVLITIDLDVNLTIEKDTVGYLPDTEGISGTNINTNISADTNVTVLIKDGDGNVVRTLVNNEYRSKDSYEDYWDCKDDKGFVVNDGVYYAVIQYGVNGQMETFDLTNSSGGDREILYRDSIRSSFAPYEDDLLPISFQLSKASEITIFFGPTGSGSSETRIRTILNRKAFPAGNHTIYWDGLDDDGYMAYAPLGELLVLGTYRYDLPDNAIYMTGGRPVISNMSSEPNYFNPMSNTCLEHGNSVRVAYTLSENVTMVELRVIKLINGENVRILQKSDAPAGENYIFWDGQDDNGKYVEAGEYQLVLIATDAEGNKSLLSAVNLIKIRY